MHRTRFRRQLLTIAVLLLLLLVGAQAHVIGSGKGLQYAYMQDSIASKTPASDTLGNRGGISGDSMTTARGQKERVFIEHVDIWRFDKDINPDAQILVGNVQFRHNDAHMFCDSALLYEVDNRFEAYGNVRIEQGDSLFIYCNYLDYDGQLMLARLRELVRMEHGENTLYTDSLDYDRVEGIGYYFDYGSIVDSLNILSSVYGEYSTVTKHAVFNDTVVLENPNFILRSDTLNYDTESKVATILGPTEIEGDSGVIYATRGVYDTEADRAYLMDNPIIESGTKWMTSDSIYYDRVAQLVEMYRNIELKDTADHVSLRGNYAEYHEDTEYGFARDSAYISDYSSEDTLYVHAHLMEMIKVDSVASQFKGLGNVRLYRRDVQAVSDSMVYNTGDSIMNCMGNPFIWSGKSQVTGDSISLFMNEEGLDYAHIRENAFVSSQVNETYYDQMRGRELFAFFSDNKMDSLWVQGNSEVIYINLSPDSIPQELTRTQGSEIRMYFEADEIEKIKMLQRTAATITPVLLLEPDQLAFPDFVWFPEGRPTSFNDIFRITPKPNNPKEHTPMAPNQEPMTEPAELPKKEEVAKDTQDKEVAEPVEEVVSTEVDQPKRIENATSRENQGGERK